MKKERKYIVQAFSDNSFVLNDVKYKNLGKDGVTINNPMILFARNNTGFCNMCRIYSFKWYKAGKLMLDLIPVRVGNIGYFFNRVNNELLGSNVEGMLTLGPDVEPMYDAEVTYLEVNNDTGFVDIDTGYIPTESNNVISLKFTHLGFKEGSNRAVLFANQGATTGDIRYRINQRLTYNNNYAFYNASSEYDVFVSDNSTYEIEMHPDDNYFYVNGNRTDTKREVNGIEVNNSIHIFGKFNDDYTPINPNVRLYSFKWEKDGVLELDLIPVRKGNIGYLYDRVNRKLHGVVKGNSNKFVIGPDKES